MTCSFPKTEEDLKKITHMKDNYNQYIAPYVEKEAQTLKLINPDLTLEKSSAFFSM